MTDPAAGPPAGSAPDNPWERRATAISCGFDPYTVTPAAARRRTGDAGHGRAVMVPVYLRRSGAGGTAPSLGGLLVRLAQGGHVALDPALFPTDLGDHARFWLAVHQASGESLALVHRDEWVRVTVTLHRAAPGAVVHLVLRDSDWGLLSAALAVRHGSPSAPQDAAIDHVLSRYLGRLDGEDGTPGAGLWGRLALEVVSVRHAGRLADTRSLRWQASWGLGGFPAGSGGRADGSADSPMMLDLKHQRVVVQGRPFRIRTLPDWEREQAAYDLGLPVRRLLAWPVVPLTSVLAFFDDIAPAPLPTHGSQDAVHEPGRHSGPQDAL